MKAVIVLAILGTAAFWNTSGRAGTADCVIALDVGHSRTRVGAISAHGEGEWKFNQTLALVVAQTLRAAGLGVHVVNPDGDDMALKDRPARAKAAGARAFLSLHHDSVQPSQLETWTWQGKSLRHNDRISGFGLFVSGKSPDFAAAQDLAARIADGLLRRGLRPSLHHADPVAGESRPLLDSARGIYRYDDLAVVKYADIPAVLLEAGIIVNREEEARVATPAYQALLAGAITEAMRDFCRDGENSGLR